MELLHFMFSDFFVFVGCCIIGNGILAAIVLCWDRFMRHLNIRKHGWPPAHLDADGDPIDND